MSDSKKGAKHPMYGKPKPIGSGNGKPSQAIQVFDLQENTTTTFSSLSEAAKTLNIPLTSIHRYLGTEKVYKKQYIFSKKV
jgi:hypothetical protein